MHSVCAYGKRPRVAYADAPGFRWGSPFLLTSTSQFENIKYTSEAAERQLLLSCSHIFMSWLKYLNSLSHILYKYVMVKLSDVARHARHLAEENGV